MENQDTTFSVLSKQIESFSVSLTTFCQRFIDSIPEGDVSSAIFQDFLRTFSFKDDFFIRFIQNCALLGEKYCSASFKTFRDALPTINFQSSEPPNDPNHTYFTEKLKRMDYSSSLKKYALQFFIHKCEAEFVYMVITAHKTIDDNQICNILQDIEKIIFTDNPDDLAIVYIEETMRTWQKVVYVASKRSPETIWNEMVITVSKSSTVFQTQAVGLLYSSTFFVVQSLDPFASIISRAFDFLKSHPFDQFPEANINVTLFLENITIQTALQNQAFLESIQIRQIYDLLESMALSITVNHPCLRFLAFLTNIIQTDYSNFITFFKKFCQLRNSNINSILFALTAKLYGKNYQPTSSNSNNHFGWRASNLNLDEVCGIVINGPQYFSSDEGGLFFVQLAVQDLQYFLETFIPRVFNDLQAYATVRYGLLKAFYIILSMKDDFIIKNPDFDPSLFHEKIPSIVTDLLQSDLHNINFSADGSPVVYTTNSFTESLLSSVEERAVALPHMIHRLQYTSFAIYSFETNEKSVSAITDYWKELTDPAYQDIFDSQIVQDNKIEIIHDSFEQTLRLIIMLCVLINPSGEILDSLCSCTFYHSPNCGSLATRSLQAIVHLHPESSDQIIHFFASIFLDDKLKYTMVMTAIFTLSLVIETMNYEMAAFSKRATQDLKLIMIVGLTLPIPAIRQKLFEMSALISSNKSKTNEIQEFLETNASSIGMHAMKMCQEAISFAKESEMNVLPVLSLKDLAYSNIPTLYVYYMASMGLALRLSGKFKKTLDRVRDVLSNLLLLSDSNPPDFVQNAMALLLSITDDASDYELRRIQMACQRHLKGRDVIIMGCLSCISPCLIPHIMPLFSRSSIDYQRAQLFGYRQILALYPSIRPSPNVIMSSLINIFNKKLVLSDKSSYPAQCLAKFSPEQLFINDFCIVARSVFDELFQPKQGFLVKTTYQEIDEHPYDSPLFFMFFSNLALLGEDVPFRSNMLSAFAAWTRVSTIPEKAISEFTSTIPQLSKTQPDLCTSVFGRYSEHLFPFYVNEAKLHFNMFLAIAQQVELNETTAPASMKLDPILSLYYRNVGRLIALCMFHMCSKQVSHRKVAFEFLNVLVFIAMLARGDLQSCSQVLGKLKASRSSVDASYSIFLQCDLVEINDLLANKFSFCSEQFIHECFEIIRSTMRKVRLTSTHSSGSYSTQPSSSSRSTMRRIPLLLTRNSGRGADQSLFSELKSFKAKHIIVDKPQTMTSFVAPWLNPFHYDLDLIGINGLCEPSFQQFSVYSFINSVMLLCDIQGLVQPLGAILDVLISHCCDLLILALINLQATAKDNSKLANQLLIYIYNRAPEKLSEIMSPVVSFRCWFFYAIQLSKKDEMFDMSKFMNQLSGKKVRARYTLNNEDEEAREVTFQNIVPFALQLFLDCRKENPDGLKSIVYKVAAFCYIQADTFPELADQVLSRIARKTDFISQHSSSAKAPSNIVTGKQPESEKWMIEEIVRFLPTDNDELNRSLLEWGLCCGELKPAERALALYDAAGFVLPADAFETMEKAIQITCSALRERTDPENQQRFNQWILRFVGDSTGRPKWLSGISYLEACLQVILTYTTAAKKVKTKVFKLAVQFLKCFDYPKISILALRILSAFLHRERLLKKLRKISENFKGALQFLLQTKAESEEAVQLVTWIIVRLINRSQERLLSTSPNGLFMALFAITPVIEVTDLKHFSDTLSKLNATSEELEILSQAIVHKSNLKNFAHLMISKISKSDMTLVIKFYKLIVTVGKRSEKDAVFTITEAVMQELQEVSEELESIGYLALVEQVDSPSALAFIRTLSKLGANVLRPIRQKERHQDIFPEISLLSLNKIAQWSPPENEINVFSNYKTFPPLLITDVGFVGCNTVIKFQKCIEKVLIHPFTSWSQVIFRAQLQNVAFGNDNEGQIETTVMKPKEFLRELEIMWNDRNQKKKRSRLTPELRSTSFSCIAGQGEMFFPSKEEIYRLGADILDGYNIPADVLF